MELDSTLVTGSPAGLKPPRAGDVLGERFEVRDALERDALVLTYRAVDQESERLVLLRVTTPGLVDEREASRVHRRLRPLVGARGDGEPVSAWPGLLAVEREGSLVATVEPWPEGASFRSVLDARRAAGARFELAELVPLIARLAAAVDGLAARGVLGGLYHGDLRAQRVYVRPDGISLTGGFLLAALPGDAVAEVLARDLVLRRSFAPEVADGLAGRPADRYAVAALVWEALEGAPPSPSVQALECTRDPALGATLARYLQADPAARPASLRDLVDAMAASARLTPVPLRDRLVLREVADDDSDDERTTDTGITLADDTAPAAVRSPAISATGSFQLEGDELVPLPPARPKATPAKALAAARPATVRSSDSRAPVEMRGPPTVSSSESPSERLAESQAENARMRSLSDRAVSARVESSAPVASADRTQELDERELAMLAEFDARDSGAPTSDVRQSGAREHGVREASARRPWERAPLRPEPGLAPPSSTPATAPALPAVRRETRSDVAAAASGWSLVVGALVVAALILGAAFWYRSYEARLRHEREIEQRLRDLRSPSSSPARPNHGAEH